jgi:hypothetical protein
MNGEPRRIEGFPEGANVPFFPETPLLNFSEYIYVSGNAV